MIEIGDVRSSERISNIMHNFGVSPDKHRLIHDQTSIK